MISLVFEFSASPGRDGIWGVEVRHHSFLMSAQHTDNWSISRPGRINTEKKTMTSTEYKNG